MSPPHTTKSRSFPPRRAGRREKPDDHRAGDQSEEEREQQTVEPLAVENEIRDVDGEPERNEDGDLREARERRVEALDLALVRRTDVADQQAGHEDREEARAAEHRRGAVDDASGREHPDGVEALPGEAHPHQPGQQNGADEPNRKPDHHLDHELGGDRPA